MTMKFSARQASVHISELEQLTCRGSQGVAILASALGRPVLSDHSVSADIGGAVNMLTLSIAADHGVELAMMKEWLPGLRVETLLILAQRYSSWQYDGPDEHELTFYSNLAGVPSTVRSNVASLLSLNQFDARALLRFRSPSDVEALTHEQLGTARSDRPSLFNIYAAALADRIQGVCRRPLFVSLPIAQVSSRAY